MTIFISFGWLNRRIYAEFTNKRKSIIELAQKRTNVQNSYIFWFFWIPCILYVYIIFILLVYHLSILFNKGFNLYRLLGRLGCYCKTYFANSVWFPVELLWSWYLRLAMCRFFNMVDEFELGFLSNHKFIASFNIILHSEHSCRFHRLFQGPIPFSNIF